MAEASATKQYKEVRLQIHLHDVTIQFFKHAFPKPSSLPPVYLHLTRGSLSLASSKVSLRESPQGSGTYVACWKREVLSMMVMIQRERDSDKFERMEVKFFLKICSKGKTNHRILGTCTFDISSLKLETLDFASEASERKQLMFHFAKKASNAIKSVTLVATFQYEAANDDSSSAPRNLVMQPPSRSPQSGHPGPLKTPEAIVGSYPPTMSSTTASSESESEPIPSPRVNLPHLGPPTSGRNSSSKSKAKKLRSIFQVRRKKSKRQYSVHRKSTRIHQNKRGIPEVNAEPFAINPSHESSPATFEAQNRHSLDTEFKIVKQVVHSPTKTSNKSMKGEQSHYDRLEKLPTESMATDGGSVQKDNLSDVPDASIPGYHHSTRDKENEAISEHSSESSTSVTEPAKQEQEQEKSTGNGPLSPLQRIGVAVLPPAVLVSEPNFQPYKSSDSDTESDGKKEEAEMAVGPTAATTSSSDDSDSTEDAQNSKEERQNGMPMVALSTKPPSPRMTRNHSESPPPVSPVDQEHFRNRSKSSIPDGRFGVDVPSKGRQSPRIQSSSQQVRKMTKFSSSPSLTAQSQGGHFHSTLTIAANTSGLTSAKNMAPSMVDLIRPVRRSLPENLAVSRSQFTASPASDAFGILKVRVTGVNRGKSDHLSHQVLSELALNPEKSISMSSPMAETPSEGIYCALTINGGNTRAETSVQPILSNRPVMWEEPEEVLFYTKKTQQVFIMCRKTNLNATLGKSASASTSQAATSDEDICVGAAILPLSVLDVSTSKHIPLAGDVCQTLNQLKFIPKSLPLQPKGSVLLQASFLALKPRFRVSCKGTVTVDRLLHVDCNPNHELCCSARVDEKIQGCTSVLAIEDYSRDGWAEEPLQFEAHGNYDYSIHIWAYSPDETEYWCGGCTLPLGMILPKKLRATSHCVVKESCKNTITVPVEPQGEVSLSFTIEPLSEDEMLAIEQESVQTDGEAPPEMVTSPSDSTGNATEHRSLSRKSPLRATLRKSRSIVTDMRERSFAVSVKKSYVEKSLPLEQENLDLKKEVEYLREELRKTKAKLAEQQFFHEKTLLELRTLQEDLSKPKKEPTKLGLVKKKMKRYISS